jgi:uncharacterized membrane protein YcaP (DUF421 family)
MDFLTLDWRTIFIPQDSLVAVLVRGTIMYLGMFVLLRVFRRHAGSVSIADLLLIVIIADAAQNGMAGEARSVTEALLLIGVIIFWDYTLDWLGFKSRMLARIMQPQPLLLVKNGRMLRRNMQKELITEEELMAQLRQNGIGDISEVSECRLEAGGEFSVIKEKDDKESDDDQPKRRPPRKI